MTRNKHGDNNSGFEKNVARHNNHFAPFLRHVECYNCGNIGQKDSELQIWEEHKFFSVHANGATQSLRMKVEDGSKDNEYIFNDTCQRIKLKRGEINQKKNKKKYPLTLIENPSIRKKARKKIWKKKEERRDECPSNQHNLNENQCGLKKKLKDNSLVGTWPLNHWNKEEENLLKVDPLFLLIKRREWPQVRPNNLDERIVNLIHSDASENWRYDQVPLLITIMILFILNV